MSADGTFYPLADATEVAGATEAAAQVELTITTLSATPCPTTRFRAFGLAGSRVDQPALGG